MSDWHRRDIADVLWGLRTDREVGLSDAAPILAIVVQNRLPG